MSEQHFAFIYYVAESRNLFNQIIPKLSK